MLQANSQDAHLPLYRIEANDQQRSFVMGRHLIRTRHYGPDLFLFAMKRGESLYPAGIVGQVVH